MHCSAGAAQRVDLPGSRVEAQPAAVPSTAAHAQAGDVVRPEPSQASITGSRWGLTHSSAADNPNSPRGAVSGVGGSEAGKEAERDGVEGPGDGVSDMQVLLSEERMDFQHVFEDSAPGMPWARVSFQVGFCWISTSQKMSFHIPKDVHVLKHSCLLPKQLM